MSKPTIFQDPWKRRYIAVYGHFIYYYNDKQTFESNPGKLVKRRPSDLHQFQPMEVADEAAEPPVLLTFRPAGSGQGKQQQQGQQQQGPIIEFRCDTMYEAATWIEVLRKASKRK